MNAMRRYWPLWTTLGLLAVLFGVQYLGWAGPGLGSCAWPGAGRGWFFGGGPGYGRGGWPMGFMGLPMILFWILVAAVIWGLASAFRGERSSPPASDAVHSALSVLAERYAKGELSKEEYLAMRKDLEAR